MRYRVKEYGILGENTIVIPEGVSIEDIRLIINETQQVVICSSMQKDNIIDMDGDDTQTTIYLNPSVCKLNHLDRLTIEIDKGDSLDNIKLPEIDTTNIASKDLERFFGLPDAMPEYTPMTEEELITEAEDIWNITFNN